MVDCFTKLDKRSIGLAAIVGLIVVLGLSFLAGPLPGNSLCSHLFVAHAPPFFLKPFILLSTIFTICAAIHYAPVYEQFVPSGSRQAGLGEFFILPIFTCAGLLWMVSAADLIMIFVSLELVTVSFYVLVAIMRRNSGSLEAGVKYLILGALSTGFIVYGITWIFGATGQTALSGIRQALPMCPKVICWRCCSASGCARGPGFKIAAVPFQFWVPDVYQGAPTPITAFLSVASKAAGFVVLLRILEPFYVISIIENKLLIALTALAALTLIYGNLAAMPQTNLKRLLGYSSIAHAGYLLIGVASFRGGPAGPAIAFT
jgi:NADH-quinone oxidoreductase subunit N